MVQHGRKGVLYSVVTANRLTDGEPVYFTAEDGWSERLEEAAVATGNASENLLARAETLGASVVEPYLFEVKPHPTEALSIRERIRALGPTVRKDLGKQAGEPADV